ncbi:MAG: triacylglycerol lipase [Verrucomicrobiales bacterium]|jgi:triacylglycerol lipase
MVRLVFGFFLIMTLASAAAQETVVLLHGLARTSRCMGKMERSLEAKGYRVLNISYPSRKYPAEALARIVRQQIVDANVLAEDAPLHFVTHSLGGIIVRYLQQHDPLPNVKRTVMLSPPNHGSEVVDTLGRFRLFKMINGPAGSQLGTGDDGFIAQLDSPDFEVGVITGDRSINLILSLFISGKDDGKVSVESARLPGMRDFRVVHTAHPFIMKNRQVIAATIRFLEQGRFEE